MTETELAEVREKAEALREELQSRYPRQQVTLTEWMAAGGINVSVTWLPDRREAKPL